MENQEEKILSKEEKNINYQKEYYKNNWINKPVFNYDSKYKKIKKLYRKLLKTKDNSLFIKLSKNIENKKMFLTDNYKDTLHNLIEIINDCKVVNKN